MKDKIVHLQEEITLMHVNNKIKCLMDGPNDPDDQTRLIKIARLKQQQGKILVNLSSEVSRLKQETSNQPDQPEDPIVKAKKAELYHLRSEILDHLLNMKVQLEEKPANTDNIELEISTLKENIREYLTKEKQGLNEHFWLPYYDISGIEEEIKYLEKKNTSQESHTCRASSCCHSVQFNFAHPPTQDRSNDRSEAIPLTQRDANGEN